MPRHQHPSNQFRTGRLRKRRVLAYGLCVAVFALTVLTALRLSCPADPFAHLLRPASAQRAVKVATQNEILSVQVGRDKYEYRLIQTEKGLAAAEVANDGR